MSNAVKFLLSVLAVFVVGALLLFAERQSGDDHGIIVKLELAPSMAEIEKLVSQYDEEHIQWLRLNTLLDFLFIVTYSMLFFFALWGVTQKISGEMNLNGFSMLALLPGALDVIENMFILKFLYRDFSTALFAVYHACVLVKWVLVAAMVLLSFIYLGMIGYNALAKRKNRNALFI